jgi:hypothetical protein
VLIKKKEKVINTNNNEETIFNHNTALGAHEYV